MTKRTTTKRRSSHSHRRRPAAAPGAVAAAPPRRRATRPAKYDFERLLRLIPGYDPFRDAEACGAWFDAGTATKALDFFPACIHHVEGAKTGEPFLLEPWQQAIVANLFGWLRRDEIGRVIRRYREVLLYVPRKNGKTPLAAGIGLYVLFCDAEEGQQDYIAAADREQAGMLFRQARGMVEREPELERRCKVYGGGSSASNGKSIVREERNSFLRVISADASTKHGGNSHLVVIDELHAQPDRELVDVLTTSTASLNRAQPITMFITTADFHRPSICNEKHDYAVKVRDGVLRNPAFLPVIYEASLDDDWTDPAIWAKANPNLGVSVSEAYMREHAQKAKDVPAYENTFKRLHLNIKTQTDVRAISLELWAAAVVDRPAEEELTKLDWYGGLDLAATTDIAALAIAARWRGKTLIDCRFWAPADAARDRERRDRVPYETWARQEYLTLTQGPAIDYGVIRRDINDLWQERRIVEIAVDRWNALQIASELAGDGHEIILFGQGFASMTAPTKELLRLLVAGELAVVKNPVLDWMASNLATEEDAAGNLKPSKKRSTEKIDGVVAAIMAIGRLIAVESQDAEVFFL